jgi:hypothetical protein
MTCAFPVHHFQQFSFFLSDINPFLAAGAVELWASAACPLGAANPSAYFLPAIRQYGKKQRNKMLSHSGNFRVIAMATWQRFLPYCWQ